MPRHPSLASPLFRSALVSAVALGLAACASSVNTSNDAGRDGSTTTADAVTTSDTGSVTDVPSAIDVTTSTDAGGTVDVVAMNDTGSATDTGTTADAMCVPGRVTTPFVIVREHCLRSTGARPVPPPPDAGPEAGVVDSGTADASGEPPDVDTTTCALDCLAACEGRGGGGAGDIAPAPATCQRTSATMGECITMRVCR